MKRLSVIFGLAATAALAHDGVKNPAVKARMAGMKAIAGHTATLGDMAKGKIPFDAEVARTAATGLRSETARIPDLFALPAQDPKSEALAVIWADPPTFLERVTRLDNAARKATRIGTKADLRASLAQIGKACQSCHDSFRVSR